MTKDKDQLEPTAFALKENLIFDDAISAIELKSRVDIFLSELIDELKNNGCEMIGHIKGLIIVDGADGAESGDDVVDKKGHIMFSITSFEEGARFKGDISDGITKMVFTINVIVFGMVDTVIEKIFKKLFSNHFG